MKTSEQPTRQRAPQVSDDWLEAVREQVASLRFGLVQIVVHDAQVVQIEKTERIRLEKGGR